MNPDAADPLRDDEVELSLVLEFLALLVADREAGIVRSAAEYAALHPGHEAAIVRAYERAAAQDPGEATDDGRRVGPYVLIRELGRGGQAVVWLARDERLSRNVALKIVPRSPLFEDLAPRFRREAMAASALEHPGICPIYDVGADDAVAWIAMRHVAGEPLSKRLASATAPFAPLAAAAIVERVARALHVAHEAGIVHRDVKPANVMLGDSGQPIVLDFGVALHEGGESLTLSGQIVGTPAYMAPEAIEPRGRRPDRRVDVFALGVVLYEMATLARPFEGPTRDALARAILEQEPKDVRRLAPRIPRDLAIVIATALEKDPGRRYRTAADLADDLVRVMRREPIAARPAGPLRKLTKFAERRPALAATLAALLLALLSGLAVSMELLSRTRSALGEKGRALDRFVRLADQRRAAELLSRERALWPALPERVPAMVAWLADAQSLLAREEAHRRSLAASGPSVGDVTEEWLREQTARLLSELERLRERVASVAKRLAFAQDVYRVTLVAREAEWRAAAERLRGDPRFGAGFELPPQLGLVPLGPDPDSGLEEFAHLASGEVPVRDATGRLEWNAASAIVLVLVPGGRTSVGATREAQGAVPADPDAEPYDGPVAFVVLDPYFLAKHEMTQAQWERHDGERPATYQAGSKLVSPAAAPRHPVETVSWERCAEVLAQLDLELPTEAQWERAARAGTTTPFWCGVAASDLAGVDNLADEPSRSRGGASGWSYEPDLDDGYVGHAPVGSFRANPFGFHDVHGNVREWCADTWEDFATNPPRDGDGLALGSESARAFRGGSFASDAVGSRSGRRDGLPPHFQQFTLGVRPARSLRR